MKRRIKKRTLSGVSFTAVQDYEIQHAALARKAAAEGIVLLKNENHLLPLKQDTAIAIYGVGAIHTVKGGTGSGDVNERDSISVMQGMQNAGFSIANEAWLKDYESAYAKARMAWRDTIMEKARRAEDARFGFFDAYTGTPFVAPEGGMIENCGAPIALYVLSRIAGEGADRFAQKGDYYLTDGEYAEISAICKAYDQVVLLINTAGAVDLSFLDKFSNIQSVLFISEPGMEGGNAVADVLCGHINPSGKLTDTWAYRYQDYPASAHYSHNDGDVSTANYSEGLFVGYRYFDTFQIPVRFGFGYGLSYTDFQLEFGEIAANTAGQVEAKVKVHNTGACAGREVVQLYVAPPAGKLEKEKRRLVAFAKTDDVLPGSGQEVTLSFDAYALASYDEDTSTWILEQGDYVLYVGNSLNESCPVAVLRLAEDKKLVQAFPVCQVQKKLDNAFTLPGKTEKNDALQNGLPVIHYDLSKVSTRVIDDQVNVILDDEAVQLVAGLTEEQLIQLATGDPAKGQGSALGAAGISVPGSAGETSACAYDAGIASIVLADGPAGLRLNQSYIVKDGKPIKQPMEASLEHGLFYDEPEMEGERYWQFCTAIPVGTLLAQTWDMPLLKRMGEIIADEMLRFGVTLWLAPGMNIHRDPLCGRNFEYYSEDPLVSGKAAAAITQGVQSRKGCGTTIKHFCCNNQEDNRKHCDSVISERALREIYLKGFEIAIKEAHPMAIMTSYNLINGVHAANSYDLCTRIARQDFGFDGFIMTDWTTTENDPQCTAAGCMLAGNDLVMPGEEADHESIRKALNSGELSLEQLRLCITRLVRVILKSDCYQ